MKPKRITLTSKFFDAPIPQEGKYRLLELIHTSENGKIYGDIQCGYPLVYNYLDTKTGTLEHEFNIKKLKKIGVSFKEREVKKVEIDFNKMTQLLAAFNAARDDFYIKKIGKTVGCIPQKPSMYRHYNSMIKFLEDNNISDWYLYFYVLHSVYNWKFVVPLKKCYTPAALDLWTSNHERIKGEIQMNELMVESTIEKSPWIHTYSHIESMKDRLVKGGHELVCLGSLEKYFGYNSQSKVCGGCSIRAKCASNIYESFQKASNSTVDILGVRAGRISVEEANKELKAQGSSFQF